MNITASQLQAICPTLKTDRAQVIADLHNEICPHYEINTPLRMAAFIGQCAEESWEYALKQENLKYSAARLLQVFPRYFPDAVTAGLYSGHPDEIANRVYANRMGNGNETSGDGWKYKGGGFLQCTGKAMYAAFAAHAGQDIDDAAAYIQTNDQGALDSAAWIFAVNKNLLEYADAGDFITITKRINGGLIGYDARKAYYDRAVAALK